ncbi:ankyrin [Lindgomyces ingoldianus]|uniref:Ankyrin n=1 Tax=Lindgomyces ingoldianus TaxID=673940 RepID=A0ACB6QI00_9PLEO|nr:ankyrin [Lindgomyces ingoldianus]KAF2465771.1 ankyrin [Lindgomyces ingoldianus]
MTKDWDSVRTDIAELSVHQKKCLQEVKAIMESKHKFRASTRAYRMKLKEWGYTRHRPRKATEDRTDGREEDEEDVMEIERVEESDVSATVGLSTPIVEESTDILRAIDPWSQARTVTTDIVMDMLAAVLEGDSQKLEHLILTHPNHVNYPIGLPFDVHGGRFFNHPAIQSCVILQHSDQTLLDIASALPTGPIIWVLISNSAKGSRHPLGTDLAFHNAIKNGRTYTVQSLLHSGGSQVNGIPGTSWRPLLQAAFWNVPDIVRLLLDQGASVNDQAAPLDGMPFKTALQLVLDRRVTEYLNPLARERCERIMKMLLNAGANIHVPPAEDLNGLTPFETFIKPWQGNPSWATGLTPTDIECLEAFIRKGADLQTSFHGFPCSARSGDTFEHQVLWHSTPRTARLLVDHAAPSPKANGANLLHEVLGCCPDAKRHPADTLRDIDVLLKGGADPNFASSDGWTPLRQCIARCPAVDIIPRMQCLLDGGANPELADGSGIQPITLASRSFEEPLKLQVLEALIAKYQGRYPQHKAACEISRWTEGYFPIPKDPTLVQVSGYGEQYGDFATNCERLLPKDVCPAFQRAAFSVASRYFLNSATERAKMTKELRLTTSEKDEIHHVITMRQAAGLPEYRFDQGFVMSLLMPSSNPTRTSTVDFSDMASPSNSIYDPLNLLPSRLPILSLLSTTLPNPPTPLIVTSPAATVTVRRASVSSTSSSESAHSFFVPNTTQIRFPVGRKTKPKDPKVPVTDQVVKYRCKSCQHGPLLTRPEYQKHEEEHLHTITCLEQNCTRRFCVAERSR